MIQQGLFFAPEQPVWMARASGRLDFMGGNVDYTGGLVLQFALRETIWAAAQQAPESLVRVQNPGAAQFGWETELTFPTAELASLAAIEDFCRQAPGLYWRRYVLGAFHLSTAEWQLHCAYGL